VVFEDTGGYQCTTANGGQSIWSYNLITNALVKLADTNTPVPAPKGAGNFVGFTTGNCCDNNLQVHDGTVLFYGYDSGSNSTDPNCYGGLYTVPVGGGAIHRIVDYTMTLPGAGGRFCGLQNSYGINGVLGMSLDRGKVVFSAGTTTADDGVWWAPANVNTTESDLHLIADGSTVYQSPFPTGCSAPDCWTIVQWAAGFIGGSTTVFAGGRGETGADGLFVNSPSSPILLSSYVLPGDEAHNAAFPYNASFYVLPVVDGNYIFFAAFDPEYQGTCGGGWFGGIFKTSLAGGTAANIMNSCDMQPNGDPLNGQDSFNQLAANEGTAVFQVLDNTTGNVVLDSSVNGVLSQMIGPGDPLPTGASCDGVFEAPGCVTTVSPPGTGGINGGRVVFGAEGGPFWWDYGIYFASLPCASALTSDVSIDLGSLTYNSTTKTWSQTATVTNSVKRAIPGPLSLVLANLTSGVVLENGNGSTVCFAPAGTSYINLNLPASNKLAPGASTEVTLEFAAPSNATIAFTSQLAGPGAR
jgi:hypothetical protein